MQRAHSNLCKFKFDVNVIFFVVKSLAFNSSKQRRRDDVSYDPSMATALRQGKWTDDEIFEKTCIMEKEKEEASTSISTHINSARTLIADFKLRQDARRFMLGKYFRQEKSMEVKKTFGRNNARQSFTKIGKTQSTGWRLRMIARKARGTSTDDHGWRLKHVVTSIAQATKG